MQPISDMWLVVHVPKTAGTSFRQALEKHFGPTRVIRDYGKNAEATTEVVREHLYNDADSKSLDELIEVISNSPAKVLVGHFPVRKYARFFQEKNILTFVRDPLVRTCSEYLHRSRNASYKRSFSDFVAESSIRNIQSRFLQGVPDGSFIGVTEKYRESLAYINDSFQMRLTAMRRNVDKKGGGHRFAENLSRGELELFGELNKNDLALYKRATQRFDALDIPETLGLRFINWWNQK